MWFLYSIIVLIALFFLQAETKIKKNTDRDKKPYEICTFVGYTSKIKSEGK